MKILFIADPNVITTIRFMNYFIDNSCEVFIIPVLLNIDKNKTNYSNKVNFVHVSQNNNSFIKLIINLKKVIAKISPDIIHIHCITQIGMAAAFCFNSIPIFVTPWGRDLLVSPFSSFKYRVKLRLFFKNIDGLISGTPLLHLHAVMFGLNPSKCFLINMGIDTTKFNVKVDASLLKERFNIDKNTNVVLVPRQWEKKQNTDIILRSVPAVLEKFPNTIFIFKNRFGSMGLILTRIVKELGLGEEVFLIDNDLSAEASYRELPMFYSLSNVTVSVPSWDAGSPSTVMEALACGSIPIVSHANCIWVRNKKNGLVLDQINKESISSGIIEILKRPDWIQGVSEYNYKLMDWGVNFENNMNEIMNIYKDLINNS
jgi:glycosyltransferase involved in cell wall biosynthesis